MYTVLLKAYVGLHGPVALGFSVSCAHYLGSSFILFPLSNSKRRNELQKSFNRLHDVFQIIALMFLIPNRLLSLMVAKQVVLNCMEKKILKVEQTEKESSKKCSFMISTLVSALPFLGEGLDLGHVSQPNSFLMKSLLVMMFVTVTDSKLGHSGVGSSWKDTR